MLQAKRMLRLRLKSSVVSYPDRGEYGDNKYRGNCSGLLIKDLIEYYQPKRVLDPMEGSGTARDVCRELNVPYVGLDLRSGFNLLKHSSSEKFDFIFIHPPYWNMIKYSEDPYDLSCAATYEDFLRRLTYCLIKLYEQNLAVNGHLIMLIGTMRKQGKFFDIARDIIQRFGEPSEPIIIKVQHNVHSAGTMYGHKFIRIAHEYVLIWRKKNA